MTHKYFTLLLLSLTLLFASCKKDAELDPISSVVFAKSGVIRVECEECTLNYTVLNQKYAVGITSSEDVPFSYVSDFELKTTISSKETQDIRLAVFDAYGRVVSNEITSLNAGTTQADSFTIKIK